MVLPGVPSDWSICVRDEHEREEIGVAHLDQIQEVVFPGLYKALEVFEIRLTGGSDHCGQ
jgi:hypothetical protein